VFDTEGCVFTKGRRKKTEDEEMRSTAKKKELKLCRSNQIQMEEKGKSKDRRGVGRSTKKSVDVDYCKHGRGGRG